MLQILGESGTADKYYIDTRLTSTQVRVCSEIQNWWVAYLVVTGIGIGMIGSVVLCAHWRMSCMTYTPPPF